jgi:hypothetical protein
MPMLGGPAKHRTDLRMWERTAQNGRWIDPDLRDALGNNGVKMRRRVFIRLELYLHAVDNRDGRHPMLSRAAAPAS